MAKRILIVEDEKVLVKALELKLAHEGYEVLSAKDGKEALDTLEKQGVDLIVLDVVMPNMDGFAFLDALKKRGGKKYKIIVVSNLSQEEDITRTKAHGVLDYYVKSDTPLSILVKRIGELLN